MVKGQREFLQKSFFEIKALNESHITEYLIILKRKNIINDKNLNIKFSNGLKMLERKFKHYL